MPPRYSILILLVFTFSYWRIMADIQEQVCIPSELLGIYFFAFMRKWVCCYFIESISNRFCRIKLLSRSRTSFHIVRSISLARRLTNDGMLILVWASRLLLLLLTADTLIRSALSLLMSPFVELFWRDWSFLLRWSVPLSFVVTTCVMWRSTDGMVDKMG